MYKNYYGPGYRYSDNDRVNGQHDTTQPLQAKAAVIDDPKTLSPANVDDQLRTIYVGNLPDNLPDSLIQQALRVIPGLEAWVRFPLANGRLTQFGFARYTTAGAVKVALEALPGVKLHDKNLRVVCEENTQRWLDSHNSALMTCQSVTKKLPDDLRKAVQHVFSNWQINNPQPQVEDQNKFLASHEDGDVMEFYKHTLSGEIKSQLPSDEREVVFDEIKQFRETSLRLESIRLAEDLDYEKDKKTNSRKEQELDEYRVLENEEDESDTDDYELELRRERKAQEHQQRMFEDRQQRWFMRERSRANAQIRQRGADKSVEKHRESARERALKEYDQFDDDSDAARRLLYYIDHPTWVKNRMTVRQSEKDRDVEDHRKEEQEAKQITTAPQPAVSNTAAAAAAPKIQITLQPTEPTTKDELFAASIAWDKIDEAFINAEFRQVVIDAVVDALGIQEDELVEFILSHVREHKSAADLVSELSEPLDEDAESLVETVWRHLMRRS